MPLPKVGIGITTLNRPHVLEETLEAIWKYTPNFRTVVVDDGSTDPVQPLGATLVRHETPCGIPAAKNACIRHLMAHGVEHLILLDDDTRPCDYGWWEPYVLGKEPYYTYCWTHFAKDGARVPKMDEVYRDSELVAYRWSMGCCQYVSREVVETVGGINPAFGLGFEEHAEWAQRIHNAGFTSFVHQDHPKATGRIWAGDEHYAVQRSFSSMRASERARLIARNTSLRESLRHSTHFVEYR